MDCWPLSAMSWSKSTSIFFSANVNSGFRTFISFLMILEIRDKEILNVVREGKLAVPTEVLKARRLMELFECPRKVRRGKSRQSEVSKLSHYFILFLVLLTPWSNICSRCSVRSNFFSLRRKVGNRLELKLTGRSKV